VHELPITERILSVVIRHAAANNAARVVSVNLRIGELSDIIDEWLQRYFNYLSKDTIASGAVIRIERLPVIFRCGPCDEMFNIDIKEMREISCPLCGGENVVLVSGREFFIKDIEVV
jgi:hydrogenase nickel incorporation protein HypA/HybF